MEFRNVAQMHIKDFASFEIFMIEMDNDKLKLGHSGQELVLCDLCILSMPIHLIFLLSLELFFHCCHPLVA